MPLLFVILLAGLATPSAYTTIEYQKGSLDLQCGLNKTRVEYRISAKKAQKNINKFAILIDGSPLMRFFSDNKNNYLKITEALWQENYRVFEIRYTERLKNAEGFYAACLQQGLPSIIAHAARIYDNAVKILGYDAHNKNHRLVALGNSIGAVLLQNMAFSENKNFDKIALTGVLLGDVQKGCAEGLNYLDALKATQESKALENFFSKKNLFDGMNWASFMFLVQKISRSGEGCCIENSSGFGSCGPGIKNEYTSAYNFEKQPYFKNSNLALFEGLKTSPPSIYAKFASANPGQVNYIFEHRVKAGAKTQRYFYENCDHSVINCVGPQGVKDFVNFLTSEIDEVQAN